MRNGYLAGLGGGVNLWGVGRLWPFPFPNMGDSFFMVGSVGWVGCWSLVDFLLLLVVIGDLDGELEDEVEVFLECLEVADLDVRALLGLGGLAGVLFRRVAGLVHLLTLL